MSHCAYGCHLCVHCPDVCPDAYLYFYLSHACCVCDWTAGKVRPVALRAGPCWALLEQALLQHTHDISKAKLDHTADQNVIADNSLYYMVQL